MANSSKRAVAAAIIGNSIVTVCKFAAAAVTHSASMMNEAVHSLMDTFNQIFLLLGLVHGSRRPDATHAFGHGQKKYLWNLWSAIGLFSIGSGLGLAHAWHAYHKLGSAAAPSSVEMLGYSLDPLWVAVVVLTLAFVIETYVLWMASSELLLRMREEGRDGFIAYVAGCDDPTLIAVFLEDVVAVTGVVLAALGIGLAAWSGDPIWDVAFSSLIAVMLGVVAFFLGAVNMKYLTDVRDKKAEEAFRRVVAEHAEVERYHDLRSIVVDEANTVLVAEIELSEQAMTAELAEKIFQYENDYRQELVGNDKSRSATHAVVQATLERAEEIIDEIEKGLKVLAPQVSHVTIEVEGIAASPGLVQAPSESRQS